MSLFWEEANNISLSWPEIWCFCVRFSVLFLFQAIAAMMRAQEVDPTNLEVLLALGVSHTNGKYCQLTCGLLWHNCYWATDTQTFSSSFLSVDHLYRLVSIVHFYYGIAGFYSILLLLIAYSYNNYLLLIFVLSWDFPTSLCVPKYKRLF